MYLTQVLCAFSEQYQRAYHIDSWEYGMASRNINFHITADPKLQSSELGSRPSLSSGKWDDFG
jgi:hypothetical protein